MVDAINMLVMQSSLPGFTPRSAGTPVSESILPIADLNFISSSIRVDNLQNVAILEYRSSKTGEVLQQFPTQAQIEAFKHAEQLQVAQKRELHRTMQRNTTPVVDAAAAQVPTSAAPVVQTAPLLPSLVQAAAPSPAPSSSPAPLPSPAPIMSSGSIGFASSSHSTQSILV